MPVIFNRTIFKNLLSTAFLLLSVLQINAQEITRIWGTVLDKTTGESIPYVNVSFNGTTIGTVSDGDGKFYIETEFATEVLKVSFIGYEPVYHPIKIGHTQTITVSLQEESLQLDNVTISGKKLRYKNKGNPAVTLIKNIIAHKDANRPQSLDYFEYEKYEKVEFDLNNISEDFKNKRSMKNFQLIFDYVDTSSINGKTYLPIFLRETSSRVYLRKSPQRYVEYKKGQKMTGFEDYFDDQGISAMLDKMYQKIDIYDNTVNVLTQKFVSPIATIGPVTYKYYIADTLFIDGEKLFKISFQPRNDNALAFVGNMFISTDSAYAVRKVSMRITKKANINFVDDLFIDQEFEKNQFGTFDLITDQISIDFNFLSENSLGMFGRRTVSYRDFTYNVKRDDSIYKGVNNLISDPEMKNRPDEYWDEARHMDLSKSELGVAEMTEQVEKLPAFKRMMDIMILLMVGYYDLGKVEIGPVGSFYSWNEIEGFRGRFGLRTTSKFSENYMFESYAAYGTLDKEYKYSGGVTRYFSKNPMNAIRVNYQKDIHNPGEQFQFAAEDNVLFSFKRGVNDKRYYKYMVETEYIKDVKNGFSFIFGVRNLDIEPAGILSFLPGVNVRSDFITKEEREGQRINVFETNLTLRFAPNEQYYMGKRFKIPIYNKHPIFTIKYDRGYEGIFGAQYSYDRLSFGIFKRTFVAPVGFFDLELEARKIWGQLPYPLLNIPQANQTYSYQFRAYNLMNFLEYVSDEYVSLQIAHYFNGFIMNKIPLVKKMKLRSIITFKGLVGRLNNINDPTLVENSHLPALPSHSDGTQATYPLTSYVESSFGIANIFRFFRLDLVKRWTQLDHPDVASGYNIRARFKVEF